MATCQVERKCRNFFRLLIDSHHCRKRTLTLKAPMKSANTLPKQTAIILAMAGMAAQCWSDTLKLKNGTPPLEGRVVSETPDSVTFEFRPSPKILDSKTFKREEIAELIILTPDEAAFQLVKKLLPTADLMSPTDYSKTIDEKIKPFLTKFPTSKRLEEVKAILKTYEDELAKINDGGQKVDGVMITKEERAWNGYVIEARVLRLLIQQDIEAKNYKDALDKIYRMEREFKATPAYVEALDLQAKLLDDYEKQLVQMQSENAILLKDREERMKNLDNAARLAAQDEIKREEAAFREKLLQEKKDRVPVPSANPYMLNTVRDAQTQIIKVRAELAKVDKAKIKEAADMVVRALNEGNKGNAAGAYNLIEAVSQMPVFKQDLKMKAMREQWKKASEEAAKVSRFAPATPAPTPAPTTAPVTGAPSNTTPAAAPKPAENKPAAKPTTKPAPAPAAPSSSIEPPPVAEETDYSTYLLGAAVVLVLAGVGYTMAKKKKANAADEE